MKDEGNAELCAPAGTAGLENVFDSRGAI